PMSSATARTWATMTSGAIAWTAATPTVFCAVIAVIAVIPCTPAAANAFRSAWIPAPPPESEPAIASTRGMRVGSGTRRSRLRDAHVAPGRGAAHETEQLEAGERHRGVGGASGVATRGRHGVVASRDGFEQGPQVGIEVRRDVPLR